ncbi:hypothetical protein ACFX2I_040295 [Malus domestica]|uniref:Myb-like domain-containing protein n=1 Tax=Malus domestica TaxID=3750 RepID=A0A498JBT4_MALDO|nr:hypothetical protein DVH24_013835 [Malus domestica]
MAGGVSSDQWTWQENKVFETALATYNIHCIEKGEWEKLSLLVPGKSIDQIKSHFMQLLMDLEAIESDQEPLPDYKDDHFLMTKKDRDANDGNGSDHDGTGKREFHQVVVTIKRI